MLGLESFLIFLLPECLLGLPVWGVQNNNKIFFRGTGNWEQIPGGLKQIEIGKLGVFGVNNNDDIFYRVGTHNAPDSTGTTWQQ